MEYPYTPPTEFRRGETVIWKMTDDPDFLNSSEWIAKATISGAGGNKEITAVFSDGVWTFTLKAADNTLAAGSYLLYQFFTKGAGADIETYPIGEGAISLTILAKLSTAATTDIRTHAQKMITLIETALETFATDQAIQTCEIAGRTYSRTDINELYALRNKYRRLVNGTNFQTIPAVF